MVYVFLICGKFSWFAFNKLQKQLMLSIWNVCHHQQGLWWSGCECVGEPSNILLCWKKFQRGYHQPRQVGKTKQKETRFKEITCLSWISISNTLQMFSLHKLFPLLMLLMLCIRGGFSLNVSPSEEFCVTQVWFKRVKHWMFVFNSCSFYHKYLLVFLAGFKFDTTMLVSEENSLGVSFLRRCSEPHSIKH